MFYVPVLGRLSINDYIRLFFAFSFLLLEPVLRVVFAILPLRYIADMIRRGLTPSPRPGKAPTAASIAAEAEMRAEKQIEHLVNTEDFVRYWGFPFEPHYATTKDGYILALHRIPHSRSEQELILRNPVGERRGNRARGNSGSSISSLSSFINSGSSTFRATATAGASNRASHNNATQSNSRPVVLLWHGFMMCSEVWVCLPNASQNLAFMLADAGYDVWLGNTRGNKYSCKHRTLKPTEEAFWDFSIDHLALHDLPDAVSYILKVTGAPSLSYIGFSQGTAQGFSALSMSRRLNKQINLFIALAPATKPQGIDNKLIHALVNTSPEIIYLLFGRKSVLSSTLFWQSILNPMTYSFVIDVATWGLFSWGSEWISSKSTVYRHLYSYTSVKMVVHWFQIIRTGRFQMYEESPALIPNATGGHLVPKFPTEQITTPFALFYGGKDTLTDLAYILRESPSPVFTLKIEEYEHLSFLWGRGIDKTVFPGILGLLNEYAEAWSDAEATSPPSGSATDLNTTLALPYPRVLGVPWITQSEIDTILEMGQPKATESSTRAVSFPGTLSVARHLKRAALAAASSAGVKIRRVGSGTSPQPSPPLPITPGASRNISRVGASNGAAVGATEPPSYSDSEMIERKPTAPHFRQSYFEDDGCSSSDDQSLMNGGEAPAVVKRRVVQ